MSGIAVVCHPSLGGSGIVATELAVGLAKRGHQVHIITTAALGRPLAPCPNLSWHIADTPDYPLFEHPPQLLALASAIARVCTEHHIDVLHVHYAVPHATSAYLARQLLGPKRPALVTTLHGTDVTGIGSQPAYQAITRMCVVESDAITTPSEFLRAEAQRMFSLPKGRDITVIANCVDTDHFTPLASRDPHHFDAYFPDATRTENVPTLLHVSNFRPVKRTRDLIDVLSVVNARTRARLVLVGDGPEREACEQRARALGLRDAVSFLGARPHISTYLQHADAFLLTSQSESFGLAALEALSSGVPVLGYRVGGLPTVVSEDVGQLVEPFDVEALARAVSNVLDNPVLRNTLARAARARALATFSMQPALERYEQLFERVCAPTSDPA
jgi:N-acetyl-alpha-D-glucosaminyl L-malate synthase BshA